MAGTVEFIIRPSVLERFVVETCERVGMSRADATTVARSLVEADLRGVHTHGVAALPGYCRRIEGGGANPRPEVRVIQDAIGVAVVDGDNGLGQVVATFAMNQAIERARATGIGAVAARNSSHFGAAGYYAMMAADAGLIGFATTSAGNRIAPIGGKTPVVGNNPLAWAIPTATERPILLDMAQSVVAAGKLGMAARRGERIPPGWALDVEGKPTDDPMAGSAGLLVPVGGPKGFGLALVMDVLSGALSGAGLGRELGSPHRPDHPSRIGHFFMALDIAKFVDPVEFATRVDRMIRDIHESEKADGASELYVAGEIEWILKERRLREGIPLLDSIVDDLRALGKRLGVQQDLDA